MGIKPEQTPQRSTGLAWIVCVQLPREEASQHRRAAKGAAANAVREMHLQATQNTAAVPSSGPGGLGGVSRSRQREPKLVMALLMAPVTPLTSCLCDGASRGPRPSLIIASMKYPEPCANGTFSPAES